MSDPMRKIMKLFLVLSEDSKTMEEVGPLADQLFHQECRMKVSGQTLNKPRIMNDMKTLVENKVTMELTKVEQDEFGITYEYSVRKPRERVSKMVAKAMIRGGQIYHVDISSAVEKDLKADHKNMRRASAPVIHGH